MQQAPKSLNHLNSQATTRLFIDYILVASNVPLVVAIFMTHECNAGNPMHSVQNLCKQTAQTPMPFADHKPL